jgi:hypothetical protein
MSFINRILKNKAKEHNEEIAQQNYSFKNQTKEIHEQQKQFYKDIEMKKKLLEDYKKKKLPIKKTLMRTIKASLHPSMYEKENKANQHVNHIKDIMKNVEETILPKKRKRTLSTKKISLHPSMYEKENKANEHIFYKNKIVKNINKTKLPEKKHELEKVIDLLDKMNQVKEIINAKKYVKNFIKNN